jgi:hypothetical protein
MKKASHRRIRDRSRRDFQRRPRLWAKNPPAASGRESMREILRKIISGE